MPQLKFRKTDVDKLLSTIKNDWVKNHAFQEDVVDNAFQRFQKRLMGWLTHSDAWTDDDEVKVSTAWTKFEDKHYACYRRWKKNSGIKDGGFDEKTIESQDFETRAKWLFLFYLVYGEIHEFRNTKNVFNVLYHCALNKFIANDEKDGKIADWLRGQGKELYKFLGLVYSNGDMIHMNFHHDDLDDLCVASHFIKKKFWHGNRDFKTAFKLDNVESSSFPGLAKMLTLDLNTFILYWLKSAQKEMDEQKREQREKWIKEVYFKEKADIVSDKEESLKKIREEGQVADKNMKDSESAFKGYSGRFKPAAEDFDDRPDMLHSYKMAWTQFETAKELLSTTEKLEGEANSKVADAKTNNFKNRKGATKSYDDATKKLKQAEQDYAEAKKGFDRAVEGFSAVEQCKAYELEARFLRDKAEFMRIRAMDKQVKVEISRKLQFEWEDSVNKERIKFAHKWKTYAETSGGFMGISGYMTIIYHYSYVSYMHCLMLFPMAWLYFDWHQYIDLSDIGGSFQSLVDINGMWDVEKNIILCAGIAVAFCLLLILAFNICLRPRMRAVSAPSRDAGTKRHFDFTARFANFTMWIGVFILEGVLMKFLVLNPTRTATRDYLTNWEPFKSITLLSVMWLPVFVLYLSSLQFVFTFWVGVYGYFYGLRDKVCNCRSWDDIVTAFDRKLAGTNKDGSKLHPKLIDIFYETMIPENIVMDDQRKEVAFARIWNSIITYFYETHRISKEEHQRYSYKIKGADSADFLSGEIEKDPELTARPKVAEVEYHLIRFVNNVRMTVKPRQHIAVKEMLPLTVCTPVGAEKILYPYEFITHVDNTQSSFLQHLIDIAPNEWENFKKKECTTDKARDWVDRMEKDIIQGVQPDVQEGGKTKKKRWIHDTQEGLQTKLKVCEWGSMRFQALYRTVHGFMQIPKAMEILARIEEPAMTQADAEKLARTKFSYVIGYQSFAQFDKLYKKTKPKAKEGLDLTKGEMEAHDAVFNIKYIKQKFPEVKIAYPDQEGGKYVGRMSSGLAKANFSNYYDYKIELFGPFVDMGLGKPTHQNYLSQFIDGLIIQTIDVNQDNVLSQCFFVPNALAEYDRNPYVKIVGLPEYIITQEWSTVAWCAAFAEHAFGTLSQRCYARHGVRLHYGHPDFHDALFVMTETGLSKMTYVSEDIFTGFDVVIKGGKIIHAEYCECGKARDVDLYTTTKFQRKISMGAGQMACSRYINQLQTSKNIDLWQGLSLYYTTVGFYLNHLMLYVSVWFALVSQLFLIFAQKIVYGDEIATFITNRVFTLQIGLALIAPGVFQLILEHGVILALWEYVSHFLILSVYATFHILNTASYWQFGLTNSAFYLASGRGTGLEHYFMRDMYDNFYVTHWRSAFIIFWMGVLALAIGQDIWVFIIMYLLPSGIWLWGAMFLNPGSLPSSVHEEQWKRLVNRDMSETNDIIRSHTSLFDYHQPIKGNIVRKIFGYIGRLIGNFYKFIHWLYTLANFSIQVRFVRLFSVIIMGYQYVLANQMPTYIFTDERRRILRWDEEETRQKSIFYSTVVHNDAPGGSKLKKSGIPDAAQSSQTQLTMTTARDPGDVVAPADNRPLPAPPKKEKVTRKRSVRFLTKKSSSNVNLDVNGSSSSVNVAEVKSKSGGGSDEESPLPPTPKSPTKGARRAAKGRASPPPAYDEAQPAPPVKEGRKPTKRTGALPALGGETPSNNNVDVATPSEPLPAPPLQRRSQLPSNGGDPLVPPTKRASSRRNEPLPQMKKD